MNEYKRLKDVFKISPATPYWTSWTGQGIFTALKNIAPWGNTVNEARLNDMYGLSRQNKIISPLAYSIYFEVTYPESHKLDTPTTTLAEMAIAEFGEKWSRLWELRNTDYDPLENYRMTETGGDSNIKTGSITRTDTGTVTGTHTGTDTLTKSGEETHSKGGSEVHTFAGKEKTTNTVTSNTTGTDNGVYGFNSATAVPSDTSTGTQTGLSDSELEFTNRTNTDSFNNRVDTDGFTNRQDTQSKNLTDAETRNLSAGETYNSVTDTGSHSLSRYGNIGVTTSEQMAQSQIELWQVFDFFQIVFKDIDSIMLLDIY